MKEKCSARFPRSPEDFSHLLELNALAPPLTPSAEPIGAAGPSGTHVPLEEDSVQSIDP